MICKKCGCEALNETEEKFICPDCGAEFPKEEDGEKKGKKDKKEPEETSALRELVDFLTPIIIAVVIAVLLKTFIFANAVVPTGSMLDTIQLGDRVIASRVAYINDDPERGDVVIFINPDYDPDLPKGNGNEKYYVKRVIGLPGETVEIVNGVTYITDSNGKKYTLDESAYLRETPIGDFGPYTVPEGSYFMMGDNRNSSLDARYWTNKYVEKDNIVGKVKFRYYRAKEYRNGTFDFFETVS